MFRSLLFVLLIVSLITPAAAQDADGDAQQTENPAFEPSDDVRDALEPMFKEIRNAKVSRANIRLTANSIVNGVVSDSQESTYHIASAAPDKYTVYLKETDQRTRIFCNGKSTVVAMAADAYFRAPDVIGLQDSVTNLPVPLGPYPEPVMALTLAGTDPSLSMLGGMKSVEIIDRGKFRGKIPSIHIRGVQDDNVTWDFWITQDKQPKPLRLLVDLTPMLRATNQLQVNEGFTYSLRFDFMSWRVTGEVDSKLFEYAAPKGAEEYKSLDHYYEKIAGALANHPLLGKQAPAIAGKSVDGKDINNNQFKNKIVVLDFWATWCVPCASVIPVLKEVTDKYADQDVVFVGVNVGEPPAKIKAFLKEKGWDLSVLADQDTKVSTAYRADAIPLTMVLSKAGMIESVHIGFSGPEALTQRLTDELEVLIAGGKIASAKPKD